VVAENPCGPKLSVTKLGYLGHIKKRMGPRLRRMMKEKTGTKFHDGKTLRGRRHLPKSEI
jgi:hypothetical protein